MQLHDGSCRHHQIPTSSRQQAVQKPDFSGTSMSGCMRGEVLLKARASVQRTPVSAQQMDLIQHHQRHLLHIPAGHSLPERASNSCVQVRGAADQQKQLSGAMSAVLVLQDPANSRCSRQCVSHLWLCPKEPRWQSTVLAAAVPVQTAILQPVERTLWWVRRARCCPTYQAWPQPHLRPAACAHVDQHTIAAVLKQLADATQHS